MSTAAVLPSAAPNAHAGLLRDRSRRKSVINAVHSDLENKDAQEHDGEMSWANVFTDPSTEALYQSHCFQFFGIMRKCCIWVTMSHVAYAVLDRATASPTGPTRTLHSNGEMAEWWYLLLMIPLMMVPQSSWRRRPWVQKQWKFVVASTMAALAVGLMVKIASLSARQSDNFRGKVRSVLLHCAMEAARPDGNQNQSAASAASAAVLLDGNTPFDYLTQAMDSVLASVVVTSSTLFITIAMAVTKLAQMDFWILTAMAAGLILSHAAVLGAWGVAPPAHAHALMVMFVGLLLVTSRQAGRILRNNFLSTLDIQFRATVFKGEFLRVKEELANEKATGAEQRAVAAVMGEEDDTDVASRLAPYRIPLAELQLLEIIGSGAYVLAYGTPRSCRCRR
jgi:hypothetical protein